MNTMASSGRLVSLDTFRRIPIVGMVFVYAFWGDGIGSYSVLWSVI